MLNSKIALLTLAALAHCTVEAFANMSGSEWETHRRTLPHDDAKRPIIIGYAHNIASGKAEQAILDGVNVVIWSFLHLELSSSTENEGGTSQQRGIIRTDLDLPAIHTLRQKYPKVVHMAAFGGWNGPHPPPQLNGQQWCEVFMEFNSQNNYIFDGVDWDYEGNDNLSSPTAVFTLETLDVMAEFSTCAKQKYGMIISMAPAESYLDAMAEKNSNDAEFSLRLDLPPRAFTSQNASDADRELIKSVGFSHAGRQCYAYVLAKAGMETFDWISIQLYEAYSPFVYDVGRRNIDPVNALMARIERFTNGYVVSNIPTLTLTDYEVKIPLSKLVIGVANKWADGVKFCKVEPTSLKSAYNKTLKEYEHGYCGIMFWTIEEEGTEKDFRYTFQLSEVFSDNAGHKGQLTAKEL